MLKAQARSGFTLIELLVVVVIIGILASIALPSFVGAQDKARNSNMISMTRSVFLGVEQWRNDHNGNVPANLVGDNSDLSPAASTGNAGNFSTKYMLGGYLPKTPWAKTNQGVNISPPAGTAWEQVITETDGAKLPNFVGSKFDDGLNQDGAVPASSPEKWEDYGAFVYLANTNTQKFLVLGRGKENRKSVTAASRANF